MLRGSLPQHVEHRRHRRGHGGGPRRRGEDLARPGSPGPAPARRCRRGRSRGPAGGSAPRRRRRRPGPAPSGSRRSRRRRSARSPAAWQERTTCRAQGLVAEVWTQDSSRRSSSRTRLRSASGWSWRRARWSGSSNSSKRRMPGAEALADAVELEEQHEVELARPQPRRDLLRLALGEGHLDAGMGGAEAGDRLRHQGRAGGRERGRAQAGRRGRRDRRELALGGARSAPGCRRRAPPGRRRRRSDGRRRGGARSAAAPSFALERRDRLRDRRLRVGEGVGGGRERAARDDLAEDIEPAHDSA